MSKDNPSPEMYASAEEGTLTVFVGLSRKSFIVHKSLICVSSVFFERCVGNTNFLEGTTNEVLLPEDDPEAFGMIINWLYGWNFRVDGNRAELVAVKAYLLADKLLMNRCKNDVLDVVRYSHADRWTTKKLLDKLPWSEILPGSLLWQFYVEQYAADLDNAHNKDIWDTCHIHRLDVGEMRFLLTQPVFTAEVLQRVLAIRPRQYRGQNDPSLNDDCCRFHDHSDGSKCEDGVNDHPWN